MKKKILYIAAIVLCLSIMTGGTLAYYTKADTARNTITTGGVAIELVEQRLVNGKLEPFPNEPIPVMPTVEVSKIVSVKSVEKESWVRMRYTVTVTGADGAAIEDENMDEIILIEPDTAKWTKKDGWWYYNTALETGETTKPLFETVTFSGPNMDNRYQGSTLKVTVTAQAVQKANNGTTVMNAAGWPET